MKTTLIAVACGLMLSACASDAYRDGAEVRPADRPECQVASSTSADSLARSQAASMVRDPCHPEMPAGRSSRQDTIKPDFSGKHD
ncbi:hypothetical protein [Pseudoxanthomonas sp. GM95]|uniref:hypothetical protein n=1 Tax=Pseudoxanthomonas sp. GM95 TaxID=1881043 RepID=UPI001113D8CA|nr:hypothetical protein [Pseudoxanthomonas sp. GM95]